MQDSNQRPPLGGCEHNGQSLQLVAGAGLEPATFGL